MSRRLHIWVESDLHKTSRHASIAVASQQLAHVPSQCLQATVLLAVRVLLTPTGHPFLQHIDERVKKVKSALAWSNANVASLNATHFIVL